MENKQYKMNLDVQWTLLDDHSNELTLLCTRGEYDYTKPRYLLKIPLTPSLIDALASHMNKLMDRRIQKAHDHKESVKRTISKGWVINAE